MSNNPENKPELKTEPPVMKRLTEEESNELYERLNALIQQKGFTNWHVIMWEKDQESEGYNIKGTVAMGCMHGQDDIRVLNLMLISLIQKIQQQVGLTEEEKAKMQGKLN
jgi:hypothetical protein